jgi:hypothetical protein
MRDLRRMDVGSGPGSHERQELADLASQTMGIPRRQAIRLADRYLTDPQSEASFLVWLARPAPSTAASLGPSLDGPPR